MKKSLSILVLTSSLALSSLAVGFNSKGSTMRCTAGPLNMGIYDKDVSCKHTQGDPNEAYCIMDLRFNGDSTHGLICDDVADLFAENTGESYSFRKKPKHFIEIVHDVYTGPKAVTGHNGVLRFTYNNGSVYDNCAQIFGSDVQCDIVRSGDDKHQTYQLIISKNS